MATEIRVPSLGESVVEATVGQWYKQAGDAVAADEPLVELETDKATVEMESPVAGKVTKLAGEVGDMIAIGSVLVEIETEGDAPAAPAPTTTIGRAS